MDTQTLLMQAEFERARMRRTTQELNALGDLFEEMSAVMASDDFVPLPAFTVQPWKEFDREVKA